MSSGLGSNAQDAVNSNIFGGAAPAFLTDVSYKLTLHTDANAKLVSTDGETNVAGYAPVTVPESAFSVSGSNLVNNVAIEFPIMTASATLQQVCLCRPGAGATDVLFQATFNTALNITNGMKVVFPANSIVLTPNAALSGNGFANATVRTELITYLSGGAAPAWLGDASVKIGVRNATSNNVTTSDQAGLITGWEATVLKSAFSLVGGYYVNTSQVSMPVATAPVSAAQLVISRPGAGSTQALFLAPMSPTVNVVANQQLVFPAGTIRIAVRQFAT